MFVFWMGAGAELNPVSNRIDSFHNFRYIQSVPERSRERVFFASWVDPALAVVLGRDGTMVTKGEEVQTPEWLL